MDSPQSVVSPFKSSIVAEPEFDCAVRTSGSLSKGIEVQRKEAMVGSLQDFIGILEYPPKSSMVVGGTQSSMIICGSMLGLLSSLKCEIFMMSRVRNYLEDQLLGFALVPLSDVLIKNGKLEKEFSLSSTDLFHSPAGFVQLSLSYNGASPDVMAIPAMPAASATDGTVQDVEIQESLPTEFDKFEFPDPKIVNENQMMVSEYIGISCTSAGSETSESLVTSDAENHVSSDIGVDAMASFLAATVDAIKVSKPDSPPSSVSTNGVSSPSVAASSDTSDAPASKPPSQEHDSAQKEKKGGDGETDSSGGAQSEKIAKPVISVNLEPEQNVVQQDIVDMYMKSMQQFTESLAKMKLPLDIDSGPTSSGSSTSDQKVQSSKNSGSRVFYGSRAFF
ncbi:hypothetical protein GH714_007149 [Hevea brasiliensis]|uniref:Uncharacterized protein n=1 Tax=Hevea brasiliensis TaxID=3981 RepID=A0A6A6KA06_HEVBR|nr:hypothetical protein GH714_007149 [Hevea brasiliensis]